MKKRLALLILTALTLIVVVVGMGWWLRPLPTVREFRQIGNSIHVQERSRTQRLLSPREWGFQTDGSVGCGVKSGGIRYCESLTILRLGVFEVVDTSVQWSEPLPGGPVLKDK